MPVAMISTSTSPAFGPSRSSSTISSGCLAAKAIAARVFIGVISSSLGASCMEFDRQTHVAQRGRIEAATERAVISLDLLPIAAPDDAAGPRQIVRLDADRKN